MGRRNRWCRPRGAAMPPGYNAEWDFRPGKSRHLIARVYGGVLGWSVNRVPLGLPPAGRGRRRRSPDGPELPPPPTILLPPPHPPKGRLAGVPMIRCTPSRLAPSSVLTQTPSLCVSPVRVWPREVPLAPVRIRVQCCHGWAREGSAPVRGTPNRLGWTCGARAYGTQPVTSRPRPGWLYVRTHMSSGVVRS